MGYNKFMEFGVELQRESVTVDEATRQYARSCEKCRMAGVDCDRCPITIAHHEKLEAILTLRQMEHDKEVSRENELKKKLDECIKAIEDICRTIYCPSQLDEQNDRLDALTEEWLRMKGGESNA